MHQFSEIAFIVAGKYEDKLFSWPRPDGNPFPYERKADARKQVNRLNREKRRWAPLLITLAGEPEKLKVDHPEAIRFGVYDWMTNREIY